MPLTPPNLCQRSLTSLESRPTNLIMCGLMLHPSLYPRLAGESQTQLESKESFKKPPVTGNKVCEDDCRSYKTDQVLCV